VDQAAAVGQEVGHVDDVALHQRARDRSVPKWVVRRPGHHAAVDGARERIVDQAAGRARRQHVQLGGENRLGRGRDRHAVLVGEPLGTLFVQVAADHLRARVRQLRGERRPDLAEPDHADPAAVEVARPGGGRQPAAHGLEDGLRRDGGGVAPAAVRLRAADHVARVTGHQVHVSGRSADVLGGDVGALEAVDHARRRLEPRVAQLGPAVVDHHRLAAAEVQAGCRRLQRHRAAEPHHVLKRLAQAARVALQAHAAEGRAQHRGMHRDDEAQPRFLVLADDDLLVVVVGHRKADSRYVTGCNGHDPLPYTRYIGWRRTFVIRVRLPPMVSWVSQSRDEGRVELDVHSRSQPGWIRRGR
jgi:hypothetical protein